MIMQDTRLDLINIAIVYITFDQENLLFVILILQKWKILFKIKKKI